MYNVWKNIQISQKINSFITRRPLSSVAKDQFHQPDATPEELHLINERLKIRKALRQEYLRKATDPHSTDPIIFDPMVQRYYSMHMTTTERFIPTFKNWLVYMMSSVIPVILLGLYLKHDREKFERKCRSGEIPYKDRRFKYQ